MNRSTSSSAPDRFSDAPADYPPQRAAYRGGGFLAAIWGWFSGLFRFLLATALFFVLLLLACYWVMDKFIGGEELKTPNLMGKSLMEAAKDLGNDKDLKKYRLSIQWEGQQPHEALQEGKVISQFPAPGRWIKAGTPIRVVTSSGIPLVEVPDLRNVTKFKAGVLLHNRGLKIGSIATNPSPGAPAGIIVVTDPPQGTGVLPPNSPVNLLITAGNTPTLQTMPNLQGLTLAKAGDELLKFGLFIAEERPEHSEGKTPGQVYAQDPAPGISVSETTRVTVKYEPAAPTAAPEEPALPPDEDTQETTGTAPAADSAASSSTAPYKAPKPPRVDLNQATTQTTSVTPPVPPASTPTEEDRGATDAPPVDAPDKSN